jgi:superfamily II DNA or RNA helicase
VVIVSVAGRDLKKDGMPTTIFRIPVAALPMTRIAERYARSATAKRGQTMQTKRTKITVEPFYDRENPNRQARRWQDQFFGIFIVQVIRCLLLVACPGGGKTVAALRAAHAKLESGDIDMVIVAAHARSLIYQWMIKAACYGLDLKLFKNGDGDPYDTEIAKGFHGIVVTYAQIASFPQLFARMCRTYKVMVILDEAHHLGRKAHWGRGAEEAFGEYAKIILTLSGTPFRTDGGKIPFIEYDDEGSAKTIFEYTYTQAIQQWVCRKVEIMPINARVTWHVARDGEEELETNEYDFDAKLPEHKRATRLRRALWDRDYLREMITRAHANLLHIRKDDPRAGAIAFAMAGFDEDADDDKHAKFIAQIIYEVTGKKPRIVTYDSDTALKDIADFEKSSEEWIVCIKMISEGVDIPRLRVGVFATNVTSFLFFLQALGRIIREIVTPALDANGARTGEEWVDDYAYLYIPKDPKLLDHARKIEECVRIAVEEKEQSGGSGGRTPSTTTTIHGGTEDVRQDDAVYRGADYQALRHAKAEEIVRQEGLSIAPSELLRLFDRMGEQSQFEPAPRTSPDAIEAPHKVVPKDTRVRKLRGELATKIRQLAIVRAKVTNSAPDFKAASDQVNKLMSGNGKYIDASTADEGDLMRGLTWVKNQVAGLQ